MDPWLNDAFDLIASKEGFSAKPYWDRNAYRIGHGSDTITRADGTVERVTKDTKPITKADGGRDLSRRIPEFAATIIGQVGEDRWKGFDDKTRTALLSTGYNYGSLPASLATATRTASDPADIAVAIAKLGANKGVNNPSRRVDEAAYSLRTSAANQPVSGQMADSDDPYSALFGKKAAAPAPATGTDDASDAFSAMFPAGTAAPAAAPAAAVSKPLVVDYKAFGAQGSMVKRYVDAIVKADPSQTPADVLNNPSHQSHITQQFPQTKAVFNKELGAYLTEQNAIGNSGIRRGFQDIGDTVSNLAMRGAAVGTRALALSGAVDPRAATNVEQAADSWAATTKAGRDEYDAAAPKDEGIIPTNPASLGRFVGQMTASGPLVGRLATTAVKGAEMLTANPLVQNIVGGAAGGATQSGLLSSTNDAPIGAQMSTGAVLGGTFMAGASVAIKAGKTFYDRILGSKYNDRALTVLQKHLSDIGLTAEQANKVLDRMGPTAVYADLDEALRTEAAYLASRGDETTSHLKQTFRDRQADAPGRTAAEFERILGPEPDVTKIMEDVKKAAQQAAGPYYTKAHANVSKIDAQPLLDSIETELKTAKGGTAAALTKARELIHTGGVLDDNITQLHKARIEIDKQISALEKDPTNTTSISKLRDVRRELDGLLKADPNMEEGDRVYREVMKTRDAFEYGQTVFKNGTRVEDLERFVKGATPAEMTMLRAGARAAVRDALDATTRGEALGAESLFGRKSANRDKLGVVFPAVADDVLDLVRNNAIMRTTEGRVLAQSHTAELQQARGRWTHSPRADDTINPMMAGAASYALHGNPLLGVATGMAYKGGVKVLNKVEQAALDKAAKDFARIVSAEPAERKVISNALVQNALRAKVLGAAQKTANFGARATPALLNPFLLPNEQRSLPSR